jgi:hypothetical protein
MPTLTATAKPMALQVVVTRLPLVMGSIELLLSEASLLAVAITLMLPAKSSSQDTSERIVALVGFSMVPRLAESLRQGKRPRRMLRLSNNRQDM